MTKSLILDSLEIRHFRAFRHLEIERLGRVNLIVGKNNVGKTCLLEALLLYASRGSLFMMQRLLKSRDETGRLPTRSGGDTKGQCTRYLFHGRRELIEQSEPIQIGPVNSPDDTLVIDVVWFKEQFDQQGQRQLQLLPPEARDAVGILIPGLNINLGPQLILRYPLEIDIPDVSRVVQLKKSREISHVFISANGLDGEQINLLWDKIALTPLEQDVLTALHIIASGVERVNLVGSQEGDGERIPMVKIAKFDNPLPLRSLGEGMNRLFGIALALANAQDGMLLIDEIDSGLHYSVQPDLWRLIFRVARQLNVQVLATTHSWDYVEAFQQASQKDAQEEGLLISLREKKGEPGEVVAILFDEQELSVVTREQIEVR
jgi:ABC-type cobalamin/Fe3+-siderophores transport system ATPase subunit